MADSQEVFEKVKEIIVDKLSNVSNDQIQLESRFVEDLGASSIDVVELMMGIEDTFDLDEISEEDAENIVTVQDVVNYIVPRVDG
jgi:acyl carrier protein